MGLLWLIRRMFIKQVLRWGSVERHLVVKGSWGVAEDDVEAVTCLVVSSLEASLFAFARRANRGVLIGRLIGSELVVALGDGALTITTVVAARGRIETKLKDRFRPEGLERSRVVSVEYICEQLGHTI